VPTARLGWRMKWMLRCCRAFRMRLVCLYSCFVCCVLRTAIAVVGLIDQVDVVSALSCHFASKTESIPESKTINIRSIISPDRRGFPKGNPGAECSGLGVGFNAKINSFICRRCFLPACSWLRGRHEIGAMCVHSPMQILVKRLCLMQIRGR